MTRCTCELDCSPHTGAIPLPAPVYQAEVNCENIMTGTSVIPQEYGVAAFTSLGTGRTVLGAGAPGTSSLSVSQSGPVVAAAAFSNEETEDHRG